MNNPNSNIYGSRTIHTVPASKLSQLCLCHGSQFALCHFRTFHTGSVWKDRHACRFGPKSLAKRAGTFFHLMSHKHSTEGCRSRSICHDLMGGARLAGPNKA